MSLSMASCRSSTGLELGSGRDGEAPAGIPFHPRPCPSYPTWRPISAALRARIGGQTPEGFRSSSPFLVRSVAPPPAAAVGKRVERLARLGKRIVIDSEDEISFVFHLMIAGRLHWRARDASVRGRNALAALDFPSGTLLLTEAGTKRRASLHVVRGKAELAAHDPGGVEPLEVDLAAFREALRASATRSSARLPILVCSPGSGTRSPTRSSTARACRRSCARTSWTRRASNDCGPRLATCWASGATALREAEERFEKVTAFPEGDMCTDAGSSRVRRAERPCSASSTPRTNRNPPRAPPDGDGSWPTARSRGSCTTTGRPPSTSSAEEEKAGEKANGNNKTGAFTAPR